MEVIQFIIIVLIIMSMMGLFFPLFKKEEYRYDSKGKASIRELEIEKKYLERQLEDLLLDKDSGKITEEEWTKVIQPVVNKIQSIEKRIQQRKESV